MDRRQHDQCTEQTPLVTLPGLTDQPGVTALRHDRESLLVAILHHRRDLLGRLGLDNDLALAVILVHPVIVERLEVIGRRRLVEGGQQRRRAREERAEVRDVLPRRLGERPALGKRRGVPRRGAKGERRTPPCETGGRAGRGRHC